MTEDIYSKYENEVPEKLVDDIKKESEKLNLNKKQIEKVLERVKEEYDKAKIQPGEAIGIVTAESFGEPGTQMSTSPDEWLIIRINNKIKIVQAGELIDGLINNGGFMKFNNSEIYLAGDSEIYVPSLDKNEKVHWKKVVEFSRHKSPEYLMKITTKTGREIVATDNHSFVTRRHNEIIPIKGRELFEGDRIPVLSRLPVEVPLTEIKTNNYLDVETQEINVNGSKMLTKSRCKKHLMSVLKLNSLTGGFIGAYLSEGSCTSGQVGISNVDEDYMDNVKKFINSINLDYKEDWHSRGFALSRDLKISSTLLARFIKSSCGKGSSNKKVPDFAYNASDEFVSSLLRSYFDGDGNFHVSRKMIRVSSDSKTLIKGISLLLTRFGIFSFKTKDKKGQSWLLIPYKYAPLFLKHIGSDIKEKKESLKKLAIMAEKFWNSKSQDYNDMISGFDDLLCRTAKKLGIPTRYFNSFTKRQKIGRTSLFRHIKDFESLALEKNIDISQELSIMKRMLNSDVIWDEIDKIEYVKSDYSYVYDLSVPGLETFTTFDGMITHNTLNVFHFAGVAEFSVTTGLPRLIEILDARKDINTPQMEIYLQKQFSKDPEQVKKIASQIKESRLGEFVLEFSINLAKLHVELELNKKRMREFGITPQSLVKTVSENMKGISVSEDEGKLILKTNSKENVLMETYKLKEKSKNVYIKGVKGIKQVLSVKSENEFIILTAGTNLKDVLEIKEVDETRTVSNDLFEVAKIFGIDASREMLIKEAGKVIEDQGLDVDIRHIMFIADVMTSTGKIKGITRSGITEEKESVLARASFETPTKHLINASLIGEEDPLDSVIENVMVNQPVPLGTGLPGLVAKMKKESDKE